MMLRSRDNLHREADTLPIGMEYWNNDDDSKHISLTSMIMPDGHPTATQHKKTTVPSEGYD